MSSPRWLSRGVASVGLASFFSDSGHELTTSVLPTFVTVTLRGSAAALGLIEGISDGLLGVAVLIAGPLADDEGRRPRLASGGYLVTAAATGAVGLAASVWQAGALRAMAWLARGARSPARDAMLGSLAPPDAYGRAFGLERAGDNLGAVAGPLLGAALVATVGIRPALYLAAVPGALAAVAITAAATEARQHRRSAPPRDRPRHAALRERGVPRALVPIAAFELGNMATTLLILRATGLLHGGGRSLQSATSIAILLYAAHNLFASVIAYAAGHWIDHSGPRPAFAAGAFSCLAGYGLFALDTGGWLEAALAFAFAGSAIGLAETAESALIAWLTPAELRGSGFGLLGGVQAFGGLASSLVVGALWSAISPAAGFLYAAGWMLIAGSSALLLGPAVGGAGSGAQAEAL